MRCKAGMFSARRFPYNITLASFVNDLSASGANIAFRPDGTKMYLPESQYVREFDLTSPWDITTASFLQQFSVLSQETNVLGLAFSSDGVKMFVVGNDSDTVHEYNLSTAWDVASASHAQSFSVATEDTFPTGMTFSAAGDKMFVAGNQGNDINEYSLSTPWDISSASYTQNFSVSSEESTPRGVTLSVDGTKLFIVGISSDEVNEYALSTAWDISTASYVQNFSVASQDDSPVGIAFSADGLRMYIVGDQNSKVYEYSLI